MPTADDRFLLDTHTFLWMAGDPGRLGPRAREVIESGSARLWLSTASIWEMAIKSSLGKLELSSALSDFLGEQLEATRTSLLDIRAEHAVRVEKLPWHHRDPFDRLLIAQALFEKVPILGRDSEFDAYLVQRLW